MKDDKRRNSGIGLTKSEKGWNNKLAKFRSRIESLHSHIQNLFECLKEPWQEEIEVQENIVTIATGIRNYHLIVYQTQKSNLDIIIWKN